jgi:tetratricopeptide (TPR) repeat protein
MALLIAGCSAGRVGQGRKLADAGQYDQARKVLYQELEARPKSTEAWRELGATFYKEGEYERALVALQNASDEDAYALMYRGLTLEGLSRTTEAIDNYLATISHMPQGKTRAMVRRRLDSLLLTEATMREERLAREESELEAAIVPSNAVAVVAFDSRHLSDDLRPVARGFAELVATDLTHVNSLITVDRLRIQTLLREQELAQSGLVDPASAPRMGRLLGAGKLIGGSMSSAGDQLLISGSLIDLVSEQGSRSVPAERELQEFFRLQKEFVFSVIDSLGIELTKAERDAIGTYPTTSYAAFLAYCRGLEYRQQGFFKSAESEFQRAAELDGGFLQARQELQTTQDLIVGATLPDVSPQALTAAATELLGAGTAAGLEAGLSNLANTSGVVPQPQTDPDNGNSNADNKPVVSGYGSATVTGGFDGQ